VAEFGGRLKRPLKKSEKADSSRAEAREDDKDKRLTGTTKVVP
jgi:hypothetical protein